MIIKPEISMLWIVVYAIEMFLIIVGWFCILTVILSHPSVVILLNRCEKYIAKMLGVFLVGFGAILAVAKNH
jgi:threonine/homoserine/homoserine lactone efflux protein